MRQVLVVVLELLAFFYSVLPLAPPILVSEKIIPKIVFRSHEQPLSQLHFKFREYLNRTMNDNPGYIQVYFDAQDRLDFIRNSYPNFVSLYTALIPGAYKSDMWRYLTIFLHGGIYNDISMRYTKPIGKVVSSEHDEFVGAVDIDPTALINGFFAAFPRHPIIYKAIELVVDNIRNMRYGCDNLDISGPRVFARAFRLFFFSSPLTPFAVRTGRYSVDFCRGSSSSYQVHLLNFSISQGHTHSHRGPLRHGVDGVVGPPPRNLWDKVQLVSDAQGVALKNKFDGYMDVIYNKSQSSRTQSGGEKYGTLWTERRVYQLLEEQQRLQLFDKYYNTNNLFRQGRSLWYLANLTKFTFPDYQTFIDMGLQECLAATTISAMAARAYSVLPQVMLSSTTTSTSTTTSASGSGSTLALEKNLATLQIWGQFNCNSTSTSAMEHATPTPPASPIGKADLKHKKLLDFAQRVGVLRHGLVRTITYKDLLEFELELERSGV